MASARILCGLVMLTIVQGWARADDWPQWMGPERDGVWRESGVLKELPAAGPKLRWRVPIDGGYAGPAVAQGMVYVPDFVAKTPITNDPNSRADRVGVERLLCFRSSDGELLWKHEHPATYRISYPSGPRATPTVVNGVVYFLGAEGYLAALDAKSGKMIWSRELTVDYKAQAPIWGYSAHPLVVDDTLYTLAGGEGSLVVALDAKTGKERWRALSGADIGYAPPSLVKAPAGKQLIVFHPGAMVGLDPRSGKSLWSVPIESGYGMSIMAPQKQDDYVFAGAVGTSLLVELAEDKPAVSEVWRGGTDKGLQAVCATPLFVGQTMYGVDRNGQLRGVDLKTGKHLWETMEVTTRGRPANSATAFLVRNDDHYYIFGEQGDLVLAKLSPKGYEEISRAHLVDATNEAFGRPVVWSHPAFAEKSIFVRNDKELAVFSLAAP